MYGTSARRSIPAPLCALFCLGLLACAPPDGGGDGKIPLTTDSEQARELYLQGRDLTEKLRFTDSRRYFLDAVAADDSFALAHLALANSAPTTNEFFESLQRAVALSADVSEGERHMILAVDAGARGDPSARETHLLQLVEGYPQDEWGHMLLGNFYLNRQEYEKAIEAHRTAIELDPAFSRPHNSMGYALRGLGRYEEAEQAFLRYIELIPGEPNPYDSYAELLMKMGRFEESIENFEKALSYNPNFTPSHVGIGNDYMFLGQPEKARESFRRLQDLARNDAERRRALLWLAASYLHEGDREQALAQIRAMSKIAEEGGDQATVSRDLVRMGDILLHTGSPLEAQDRYRVAVEVMEASAVPEEVKENFRRNHLYREASVALAQEDAETARRLTAEYGDRVAAQRIAFEQRRHHELLGRLAVLDEEFEAALAEFARADQQDPIVLCLQAEAWHGRGDTDKARELVERAASFNGIDFDYAFVRAKALDKLEEWN
jgi:tetratricopeptide (TPR) repeat protein